MGTIEASNELWRAYTAEEVADMLHVSVRTLRRVTTVGTMPCRRIGRAVRYTAADISTYLERVADEGTP